MCRTNSELTYIIADAGMHVIPNVVLGNGLTTLQSTRGGITTFWQGILAVFARLVTLSDREDAYVCVYISVDWFNRLLLLSWLH